MLTDLEPIRRLEPPGGQPTVPKERLDDAAVEVANDAGAGFQGQRLVLFLSATVDNRILVQYAHDPATDTPAGAIGEVEATSGMTVINTVECLLDHTGEATRLDAVVAAVEEQQSDVGRTANALHRCEVEGNRG